MPEPNAASAATDFPLALVQETVSFDDFTSALDGKAKRAKLSTSVSDSLVDVENLDEAGKLEKLIESQPHERTVGGIIESVISHPPAVPPLDIVSSPS